MNEAVSKAPARGLSGEVYQSLLDDILNCRLPGGTVIQERKLASSLGVSRSPMRDALNRLEGEGLLTRLTDRLLTVRVISLNDYLHSLDMRALIEPQAAAQATGHVTPDEIERLSQKLDEIEGLDVVTPELHWMFDDMLHDLLAERSGNIFMTKTIREMRRYTKIFEQQTVPAQIGPGVSDHRRLIDALRAESQEKVKAAMSDHIKNVRRRTLAGF